MKLTLSEKERERLANLLSLEAIQAVAGEHYLIEPLERLIAILKRKDTPSATPG